MSDIKDIRAVQEIRPDLNNGQADEILNFLNDVYSEDSFTMDNRRLFEAAADMIFPEEQK